MTQLKEYKKQIGLIRYYQIQKLVRRWKKMVKNSRHRLNVLKQWIHTEQNYINDLNLIIERIQKPMIKKKLINEDQQAILFPNIDVIIQLSTKLLEFLRIVLNTWHPKNSELSTELLTLYPFFRIYISYCNVFNKGQNILKDLRNNPTYKDIEKTLPMDIASYLIKPVQRPPKYMLLLRDFQKHMNQSHKDFNKLTEAITKYHQVNQINNDAIAKQGRAQKMFYLQKLAGGILLASFREFLGQSQGFIGDQLVTLYRLTDLVIICSCMDTKQNIIKMIYLDGSSYVQIIPDGKYFNNYLFLCGKRQCINLNFYNKEDQNSFYQNMNVIINDLIEKQNQRKSRFQKKFKPEVKVRVTLAENKIQTFSRSIQFKIIVSGAQKRPLSSIKNDTIYIIKFHIPKPWYLTQYIFLRYSIIEEIEAYLRKKYPQIQLPQLKPTDMGSYQQTKNSTKIIEFRQMAITQFLNIIFRNQRVMSNPLFLIQKLSIQQNFWAFAIEDNKTNCLCDLCSKKQQFTVDRFFEQKQYYLKNFRQLPKDKFCIRKYMNDAYKLVGKSDIRQINTFTRMLTWMNYFQGRIDYTKIYKKKKGQKMMIKIWFPNVANQFMDFEIQDQTTVGDLLILISKSFGIHCIDDFGLFLEYNGRPRLLDSDQNVCQVMLLVEGDVVEQAPQGFINKIHKWGTDLLHGKKSRVYLRKYIFLSKQLQISACNSNIQRYRMIVEQIFYDVKQNTINLSDEDLVKISAYFVSNKSYNRLQYIKKTNFPKDTLTVLLPPNKSFKLDSNNWISAVFDEITWCKKQITPPNSMSVLYKKIIDVVQNKESFRCFWFNVDNYYPQRLKNNLTQVLIGANYQNFMVLDPKTLQTLVVIPLLQLKYRITIYSIFIDTDDSKYRFDGRMLSSLSKIIEKYKIYNKMFINLEVK